MRYLQTVLLIVLVTFVALPQSVSETCLSCHSEEGLTYERNGKEVSLFVNEQLFQSSIHASFECTDCHEGFNAEELPHKDGSDIYRVDCSTCHDAGDYSGSIHGIKKVQCSDCHTKHAISSADNFEKTSAQLCVSCHKTSGIPGYLRSSHYTSYLKNNSGPGCASCHGPSHTIKKTIFSQQKQISTCGSCHKKYPAGFATEIHRNVTDPSSPTCTSCHGAHSISKATFSASSQTCLNCHLNAQLFKGDKAQKLVDFVKHYQTSIHALGKNGKKEAAACVDCHGNHIANGIEATRKMTDRANLNNTCGKCHESAKNDFLASTHGKAFQSGSKLAPVCTDCHGEHEISAVGSPAFNKLQTANKCLSCHGTKPEIAAKLKADFNEMKHFEQSAHFAALKAGNEKSAGCADCHTGHSMLPASDPRSTVHKKNLAKTCGSADGCHSDALAAFNKSIHKEAIDRGVNDSPTCSDCHGNHQNISPRKTDNAPQFVSKICSDCHSSVEMAERYNIPLQNANSYYDSFHGLAVRGGSKFAADCASCHNYHDIQPSTNPASSVHPDNLSETCGRCHPGANLKDQFKQVHLTGAKDENPILYYAEQIYIWIIVLIIGGMLLHNILDLYRKMREKHAHKQEIAELKKQGKYYIRMTLNERIQHFLLLTSFIGLVISGFGLVYPEAFWVRWIRAVMGDDAFELRGISHRILGIVMIAVSLYHAGYLAFSPRGRQLFLDLLPKWQDAKDVWHNVKYLIGIEKHHPHFDRFSYMEKAEYWALVWGTFVMAATGLVLMFNNYFLANYPKFYLDLSTIIHYYEAWLATLAIVVWHFYYVIFNPIVYPLNTAFLTGMMSEEVMEKEHPKELERLKEATESFSGPVSQPENEKKDEEIDTTNL